eukprot:jgi/Psemu1/1246/gm1.1246_g
MTTSKRHNKCQTKSPFGVAALGTILGNDSQAAGTKNHDVPPTPEKSSNSQTPSKGALKHISQDNDVPEDASKTAARTNEETSTYLFKSDTFSFRRRFGLPKSSKVCGKESWIGTEWSDVCKYGVCEGLKKSGCFNLFYLIDDKGLNCIQNYSVRIHAQFQEEVVYSLSNQEKKKEEEKESVVYVWSYVRRMPCQIDDFEMKKKWDNFQSLLWHVHGEREIGDTKPCLYGCNVVTIKKYMVLYQEFLVWYTENAKYSAAPEKLDQDLWFYTKHDNGSSHDSGNYVADLVVNLYHIHFDFDQNIVTLSPSEIGEGNICLAPTTVKQGIIYLVKEWLIRKMVDWGKNLWQRKSPLLLGHVMCAFLKYHVPLCLQRILLWLVEILQKKFKLHHTGSFGLEDVIETIEDLVLTEQRYLDQSQFEDKEYEGFQCDDCLYIYPPPWGGLDSKCTHITFENSPGELIKDSLKLPEMLVDQLDELFMAKLEVVFLSQTNVQNIDEHFGKEGNKVYLSGVFKHLEGANFKYHTLLDFETWDCFKDTKADLQNFKESQIGPYAVIEKDKAPHCDGDLDNDGDNESNQSQDKGNNGDDRNVTDGLLDNNVRTRGNNGDDGNVTDESLDNDGNKKPAAKNSNDLLPALWVQNWRNKWEESVQSLNYSLDVTLPKFPLTIGRGFALHDIKVMLKDPDPEILHHIYQIGQKVVYVGDLSHIGLVDAYVSERYDGYDVYPGYKLFSNYNDSEKHGKSGEAQHKNKGSLLWNECSISSSDSTGTSDNDSISSSDSTGMSDNEKGLEYDPEDDGNSEGEEDNECQ